MGQTSHGDGAHERPGHHWRDPARVREYVARMDRHAAERREQLTLLARLIPFPTDTPLEVLDLGAGYGAVAAAVLDTFPLATAVLLDVSEEMIRLGGERMAPYAGRYRYVHGDFADGVLPAEVEGPFHAVVSSLAIHHLPPEGKQSLYRDIAARLVPGGCFLNLDIVAAPDPTLTELYTRIEAQERAARGEAPRPDTGTSHHSELQPLDEHLAWLRAAGLVHVDCFWKRLGTALFGGYRPSPAP
jgi:SAM-dependent methyltransferase